MIIVPSSPSPGSVKNKRLVLSPRECEKPPPAEPSVLGFVFSRRFDSLLLVNMADSSLRVTDQTLSFVLCLSYGFLISEKSDEILPFPPMTQPGLVFNFFLFLWSIFFG